MIAGYPLRAVRGLLPAGLALALLALAGCAALRPESSANRPDGEGYAGTGALVLRLGLGGPPPTLVPNPFARPVERATVEVRYLGLDASGRAVFQRHDVDRIAGDGSAPAAAGPGAPPPEPDTRQIVVDLRTSRQLRVQGKIIEILEATASGVVFRIY